MREAIEKITHPGGEEGYFLSSRNAAKRKEVLGKSRPTFWEAVG